MVLFKRTGGKGWKKHTWEGKKDTKPQQQQQPSFSGALSACKSPPKPNQTEASPAKAGAGQGPGREAARRGAARRGAQGVKAPSAAIWPSGFVIIAQIMFAGLRVEGSLPSRGSARPQQTNFGTLNERICIHLSLHVGFSGNSHTDAMVTPTTILQVNKVMSILFYVIFLAYLRGIQSTNMDQRSLPEDSINSLIIKLIQADILKNKLSKQMVDIKENYQNTVQKEEAQQDMDGAENVKSDFQPVISMDTELLRQQRRYNSPRVLLSDNTPLEPPPLYLMEDYIGSSVVVNRTSRRKRYAEHKSHRGEYSVCDSESLWVTDKSSAIDIRGHQVTVLGEIKTGNSPVKQYFYETRCKEAKPVKNGCRGIDDKHWNSQCKTSQTYVRALTSENNKLVGWRWIRIDTSCVCALSRKIGRT
ncbi:neurotrophin-3 isoform X1 [Alligator mississippiensis]|uniref:neurotrophin-3 isoform X1 n=1 Tax=Alligator mississippiensis TaxID=8496 RepID=UPI002877A4FC|nr:neurotrophin-3 isoform X1 [Alligator mississippiensis]